MNDLDDDLSAGIEDYLLSLADSLNQAQRQLNNNIVRDASGSAISYQLPKLDFEMKMSLSLQSGQSLGSAPKQLVNTTGDVATLKPKIMAQAISKYSNTSESAVSIIRGSFIAVPVNGGKTLPRIFTEVQNLEASDNTDKARRYQIVVTLQSDIGEPISNTQVEFNLDTQGVIGSADNLFISANTQLVKGVVTTNDFGIATNVLNIAKEDSISFPVVIDALGQTEIIYF